MKQRLLFAYSVYGLVVFGLIFLLLLPFFLIAIFIKPLERIAPFLNHIWARTFFFFLFLNRTKVRFETKLNPKQRCILCANHTSYLDIPTMGLINHRFKFIGKASLKSVPVWGFMYSKLHILVDRESLRSRHNSWVKAKEAIEHDFSIVFFPEGGILTKEPPKMVPFKEGAFRIAVEQQIPIVPVTIPNNHILLPDEIPLVMHPGVINVQVHEPIWPEGTDEEAVVELKKKVRKKIEETIEKFTKK